MAEAGIIASSALNNKARDSRIETRKALEVALKRIEVVGAVIVRDGKVLATQRGYGNWEGWWEFPGGKVEAGEAPEQALVREIHEELNAAIVVGDYLCTAEYDYPDFHLSMRCYVCALVDETFELLEHHAARWLDVEHLEDVRWLPADVQVIEAIREEGVASVSL